MIKAFFICLILNVVSLFVLHGLAPSAFALNKAMLGMAYLAFGMLLMVAANVKFLQVVYARIRGKK